MTEEEKKKKIPHTPSSVAWEHILFTALWTGSHPPQYYAQLS